MWEGLVRLGSLPAPKKKDPINELVVIESAPAWAGGMLEESKSSLNR